MTSRLLRKSTLSRDCFGINHQAIAFFHGLYEEIVSFRRTGEHPRNLRPEFSISRPAQPLSAPAGLCVAGKRGNAAQSKMPMRQERVAPLGGEEELSSSASISLY